MCMVMLTILDANMDIDVKLVSSGDEYSIEQDIQRMYSEGYKLSGGVIPVHIGAPGVPRFTYFATLVKVS